MNYRKNALQRGFTMIEMIVVLAILSATFVGIMVFMDAIVKGLYSESIEADQQTRMASRMFEMVTELRQATAQSIPVTPVPAGTPPIPYILYTKSLLPFGYIPLDPIPRPVPSISFRLPTGTDPATGQIVWGNLITYYLSVNNGKYIDAGNTVQDASILRDETTPVGATTTTVIEDHVPYIIPGETYESAPLTDPNIASPKGVKNIYGFNVFVNNNTITITVHKTGETRVNLSTTSNPTKSTNGTLATTIFTGVYTLRNPRDAVSPSSTN